MKKFSHHYYNSLLKEADSKGGTVDNISLEDIYLKELPDFIKDLHVINDFRISRNQLKSCKNFPKFVGQDIMAADNKIEYLEGIQNIPSRILMIRNNNLKSLEHLSQFSGYIRIISFSNNKLTSCKGLENISTDELAITNNKISSWDDFPKIENYLTVSDNKLTSWKGMPSGLKTLVVTNNWDVLDFKDFIGVEGILDITTSRWTNDSLRTKAEVKDAIRNESNVKPPSMVYLYSTERL